MDVLVDAMTEYVTEVSKKPSDDVMEVILGISEGPIQGLVNGAKSFYINDTPLMNAQGEYNFDDLYLGLHSGIEFPEPIVSKLGGFGKATAVNVNLEKDVEVVRETTSGDVDAIDVRLIINQLYYNGKKGPESNTLRVKIEYKAVSSTEWLPFVGDNPEVVISGRIMSPRPKEFRRMVSRIAEPYEVRVTTLTTAQTAKSAASVSWESLQEITTDPMDLPNTAAAHLLVRASDQFSGIPRFSGVYRGLLMRVPTNYDPETRTYTGAWDGTFKLAWTNNPAWFLYECVMNDRWGVNAYQPLILDKYDVYEAAQWCDDMVDDGRGGLQPRYTFNDYITEPKPGPEFLRYVAGAFNAVVFEDENGVAHLRVDKDEQAVTMFSPENVVDGVFEYSYTDLNTRYNDITVSFRNPDLNWEVDRRRVYDQNHIDKYGRIPLDFTAVGCTNAAEAIRRAQYKLLTSLTETEIVQFKTNRLGQFVEPFEIILIADPAMGYAISGRIQSLSQDRMTVYLRDPVYLEAGISYTIKIQLAGSIFETSIVNLEGGSTTTLQLSEAAPAEVPEKAVFSLGTTDGSTGVPKPYRVMSIAQEGDGEQVTITALEVNRDKWALADVVSDSGEVDYVFEGPETSVHPPGAVTVTHNVVSDASGLRSDLELTWEHSPDPFRQRYVIEYSWNDGPFSTLGETGDNNFVMRDVPHGDYVFRVYTRNWSGYLSIPSEGSISFSEVAPVSLARVTGLELAGQGNDTVFSGRDPVFQWRVNSVTGAFDVEGPYGADSGWRDPTFRDYKIEVFDPDSGQILRTDFAQEETYVYSYEKNFADGGPRRRFGLRVYVRDRYNRVSPPSEIVVQNPVPSLPTNLSVTPSVSTVNIRFTPPQDTDLVGALVWMSETSGFTPDDTNLVYDGPDYQIHIPAEPGKTYYLRLALYDAFGKVDLNLSAEYVTTTAFVADSTVPAVPTNLVLSQADLIDPSGATVYRLRATVDPNTEEDFLQYDWAIRVQGGNFVYSSTSEPVKEWVVEVGKTYEVMVRSQDVSLNKSDFSPVETITIFPNQAIQDSILEEANQGTTKLKANLVEIDGQTTLNDWRHGGDTTRIDGGAIAANTVTANKLEVGSRNLLFEGLQFSFDTTTHTLTWNSGTISYTDDAGNPVSVDIAANTTGVQWTSGTIYIYWLKDAPQLATTLVRSEAIGADKVLIAAYRGGADLVALYSRTTIDADQIRTPALSSLSANLGTVTAGLMQNSAGSFIVDLNSGEIVIAAADPASSNYMRLTRGDLEFYQWTGVAHELRKSVKNHQMGTCNNGATVQIPGYFDGQPSIQVSPNNLKIYDHAYAAQSQTLRLAAENITEYSPGKWQFDAVARLELSDASGTTIVNDASGPTSSNTWSSDVVTTPANCTETTLHVLLRSVRGTGTAPTYYKRSVKWRVGYRQQGTSTWSYTTWQVKNMPTTSLDAVVDQRTVSFGSATTWEMYIEFESYDTDGTTFDYGSGGYNYTSEVVTNYSTVSDEISTPTGAENTSQISLPLSYTPPSGWEIYQVDYSLEYAYYLDVQPYTYYMATARFTISAASDVVTKELIAYSNQSRKIEGSSALDNWTVKTWTQASFTSTITGTLYTQNDAVTKGAMRNLEATVYLRKPIENSTTPDNSFEFDYYDYILGAATVLATGTVNWIALG